MNLEINFVIFIMLFKFFNYTSIFWKYNNDQTRGIFYKFNIVFFLNPAIKIYDYIL